MGTVVLDSSVVIAFFDEGDAHHRDALAAIGQQHTAGNEFSVPASVLSEVLVGESRRHRGAETERLAAVARMFGGIRVIDEEVAVRAARLRAKHRSLRLPDALVIAVGLVDDAAAIVTANKRWAAVDSRVQVLA